ncbi:MAG: Lycopene cyclase [Cytophagales bacterium]|nr:MAG: Lycopene cyclase [Cytophagales bacterium]
MNQYDYIIIGGGCAGLSLAYHLNSSTLSNKKVLIIDKEQKNKNDRTWCFWTDQSTKFDHIVYKSWKNIEFLSENFVLNAPLHNFTYKMIRGADFYKETLQTIGQNPNFHITHEAVISTEEVDNKVLIKTSSQEYLAHWVFDSRFDSTNFCTEMPENHYLMQHFKGWVIETEEKVFDTSKIRMFDFRTEQGKEVRFFYILPFSPTEALVEYTLFSKYLIAEEEYDEKLKNYIHHQLQIDKYQIKDTEFGIIPMTDYKFGRKKGRKIMKIGIGGGRAKPSTGYAFYRIQQDSAQIVKSLEASEQPFYRQKNDKQYQIYDALILNIMNRKGESIKEIFTELFKNNPIERVLSFLNESTNIYTDFLLMSSVPPMPFLKSIKNVFLSRKLVK